VAHLLGAVLRRNAVPQVRLFGPVSYKTRSSPLRQQASKNLPSSPQPHESTRAASLRTLQIISPLRSTLFPCPRTHSQPNQSAQPPREPATAPLQPPGSTRFSRPSQFHGRKSAHFCVLEPLNSSPLNKSALKKAHQQGAVKLWLEAPLRPVTHGTAHRRYSALSGIAANGATAAAGVARQRRSTQARNRQAAMLMAASVI
jgi:hypothetical protein